MAEKKPERVRASFIFRAPPEDLRRMRGLEEAIRRDLQDEMDRNPPKGG